MMYPFKETIESLFGFCDEVCVLDSSDIDDGTRVELEKISSRNSKLKIKHIDLDWKAPNHGIFDGETKQLAREMCTGQFLWQSDIDEIVHEDYYLKIPKLIENVGENWKKAPILSLPIVEFWGSGGKVRIDINSWKWRLSVNSPVISHGIPKELRKINKENGLLYAMQGTDTCDYIHKVTKERLPFLNIVTNESEKLRLDGLKGSIVSLKLYENFINKTMEEVPTVFHYSWFNIERKINQYKLFWTDFWKSMYDEDRDEKTNPFFNGMLWSEVSDELIKEKANLLEQKTGGHIFHSPWNGTSTPSIKITKQHPTIMKEWILKYENYNK